MASLFPKTLIASPFYHLRPRLARTRYWPTCSKGTAVRTMSSGSAQRVFQLKLNPVTGNSEWVVIDEDRDESFSQNFQQPLLATTSYLDMLNDSTRSRAYREAIEKTITKPCHVLDIGYFNDSLKFCYF